MRKTCFILALLFLFCLPNISAALLTDNLIGYWKFDNNGADSSGGDRNLTLQNGADFSSGLLGQALDLDRDFQQYAQRPVSDSIYNFGGSDFTLQVWANFNTLVGEQILMEKFQGESGPAWTLTYYPYYGPPKFHFYTTSDAVRIYSDDVNMNVGEWQQIIVRRIGSSFELFFNDAMIGSLTYEGDLLATSFPLLIGRRNSGDTRGFYLDGKLDEIAIWNRALADDEITMLYNQGMGYEIPVGPTPTLILFEDFEDSSGFTIGDVDEGAGYWGLAALSGTGTFPSEFQQGDSSQSGTIFYGAAVRAYMGAPAGTVTIALPDLSGYTNLKLTVALAANDQYVWENSHRDSLHIIGGTTIDPPIVECNVLAGCMPITGAIDSFLPYPRPGNLRSQVYNTVDLHRQFADFEYAIDSTLKSITFAFASTGGDEVVGIDSVRITGDPIAPGSEPVALCQNVTAVADSTCTAPASIDNGSYDPNGDSISSTQSPSGPYSLGDTTVTLTVMDSEGASSQCTGTVTVVDKTAPEITSASVNPSLLWPPNRKMANVTVDYNVTEDCGQPICQISSVTSNEEISTSDYAIVDAHHVKLTSDRLGSGNGRIYTITITCTDASGNSASQTVTVTVPHDQGKK